MKRVLFYVFLVMMFAMSAYAVPESDNISEDIIDAYRDAASEWTPTITGYAIRLFWLLAILDLAYMGITLALKRGDMYDFVFQLVRKILFFGFFFAVLNHGQAWMMAIVNSFREIGANVPGGASGISPGDILENAYRTYLAVTQETALLKAKTWAMSIAATFLVILAVGIAAIMLLAMIEMYFALAAGQILLGFGGSEWTKDYAISYVKYVISVGLKLLAIQLLAAIGNNIFRSWATIQPDQFNLETITALTIGTGLLFCLIKSIPGIISGIISGGQFGSPSYNVFGMAATAGAMAIGGMGMAGKMAGQTAAGMVAVKTASQMPGSTAKNIAGAAVRTFMDNRGKAKPFRSPIVGGTYANLKGDQQLNNLRNQP